MYQYRETFDTLQPRWPVLYSLHPYAKVLPVSDRPIPSVATIGQGSLVTPSTPPYQRKPAPRTTVPGEDVVDSREFEEYGLDIISFMHELEEKALPNQFLSHPMTHIHWSDRVKLLVWLIQVHQEYNLTQETLYLTVNTIDRVCSRFFVRRDQYQLIGITALWTAAKYEENHGRVPSLKSLCQLCRYGYVEQDFVRMERFILRLLNFDLGGPTCEAFLKTRCKQLKNIDAESLAVARYLMELTLVTGTGCFITRRPSIIASASVAFAEYVFGRPHLLSYGQWQDHDVYQCVVDMMRYVKTRDVAIEPVRRKYSNPRYIRAVERVDRWILSTTSAPCMSQLVRPPPGILTPPKDGVVFQYPIPATAARV